MENAFTVHIKSSLSVILFKKQTANITMHKLWPKAQKIRETLWDGLHILDLDSGRFHGNDPGLKPHTFHPLSACHPHRLYIMIMSI